MFLRKLVEPDPVKWYSTEISYLIHLKIKGVFDPIEHAISALEAYEKQKLDDFNKEVIKKFGSQAEMQHLFISFLSHISSTVEWRKWAKESAYLFLREYSPEELKRTVLIARHNTSNLYDLYDSSIDEPIVEEEQSPDMRFLERLRIFKDKIQRHSNRASREVKGRVKNLITSIEQGEKEAKRNMDIKVI